MNRTKHTHARGDQSLVRCIPKYIWENHSLTDHMLSPALCVSSRATEALRAAPESHRIKKMKKTNIKWTGMSDVWHGSFLSALLRTILGHVRCPWKGNFRKNSTNLCGFQKLHGLNSADDDHACEMSESTAPPSLAGKDTPNPISASWMEALTLPPGSRIPPGLWACTWWQGGPLDTFSHSLPLKKGNRELQNTVPQGSGLWVCWKRYMNEWHTEG